MSNRKWTRLLCCVLAVCLFAGLVFCASAQFFVGDMDGDGKITAFDAQLIAEGQAGQRELSANQQQVASNASVRDMIRYIFSPQAVDSGDVDGDGIVEIYTAEGLQSLRNYPAGNYILMNDIDLEGLDWEPLSGFTGTLNGNGKTISNLIITTGAPSAVNANSAKFNMGFFGDLHPTAVVSDLNLSNVTVVANEEAQYMGLLAGSSRGQFNNCTATGIIIDEREEHTLQTFVGALVGRIPTPSQGDKAGIVAGGTTITAIDEYGKQETTGLCADVKLLVKNKKDVNIIGGVTKKIGLVGFTPAGATVSGIFRDSSNSSSLLSQSIQARRQTAVSYMNQMGLVMWTPPEQLIYLKSDGTKSTYKVGTIYRGIPYNHKNGSYERAMSVLGTPDANGIYTLQSGLGDSIFETRIFVDDAGTERSIGGCDGFTQYIGNDCSTAVVWAWRQVSPIRVTVTSEAFAGGANPSSTRYMVPNDSNRESKGTYPIGSWVTSTYDAATGKWTAVEYDPSLAAYAVTEERSTEDIVARNGVDAMLEAYAQAHRADGMVSHRATATDNGYENSGHCRMLTADPMIIRKADGTIDPVLSYAITTEQGSPDKGDGWTSSWKVNYVRSFETLMLNTPGVSPNPAGPFIPLTIRALQDEDARTPYVSAATKLSGPTTGKFYSNYGFISFTITVMNSSTVLFRDENFTGINFQDGLARGDYSMVDLSQLCTDSFYEAAAEANLRAGRQYYYTVEAKYSNGEVVNLNQKFLGEDRSSFTYTPAE